MREITMETREVLYPAMQADHHLCGGREHRRARRFATTLGCLNAGGRLRDTHQ